MSQRGSAWGWKTGWAAMVVTAVALVWAAPDAVEAQGTTESIASMIARAQPGDTIVVPPGVYREQVVVDKPILLVAKGKVVIDAGRQGDVVRVNADDVTIRGFTIQASARDVVLEPAGIRVLGDRATIEANRVQDSLYGIVMEDSTGHRVAGNHVSSIPEFGTERRGHALYLWHTDNSVIEDNTVVGAKDGIFVGFANHNRVERNRVSGARYGIHYMYADHNLFVDNVFRESVAGGAIMFSRDIVFRGNEFSYNRSAASGYGLLFKDVDDVEMTGNFVHHNRLGVTLEGAPHTPGGTVTLRDNLIAFNDTALELATTTGATLVGNTFTGNREQVATSGGNAGHRNVWALAGRGNYWDDYRGYDANGDGVGDIPFHYDGAFDELIRKNEWVRAYSFTPARLALDQAARWFPAFRPEPAVIDPSPLIRPPMKLAAAPAPRSQAAVAGVVVGAALLGILMAARLRLMRTRATAW